MMRVALAKLTTGLRWSNPERAARLYMKFARAERSSYYDLLAAARLCRDPARRAAYLRHAGDEGRHALMFGLRARELAAGIGGDPAEQHADFEQLFARLGERRFLAFVHVGERRGRAQLGLYRDELAARGDERGRALLDAVLVDEARHQAYTGELLLALSDGPAHAQRALLWARLWELGGSARRGSRVLFGMLFTLCMHALYLAMAPLALLERARGRERRKRAGR